MNINYETGDVLKNKAPQDFADYSVPKNRPTEEWAGNEIRSYQNYIRPVANLFENDRENAGFVKDVYKGINPKDEYAVLSGCEVVKQTGTNYYEVKHGVFICGSKIYYIFPACEAAAKQIEVEYQRAGYGDLRLEIEYDYDSDTYSYEYITNLGERVTGTNSTAVGLISTLLTALGISSSVESHILLPIFNIANNITTNIFFNSTIQANATVPANSVKFATITNGSIDNTAKTLTTIDGSRIDTITGRKIKNESLVNPWVKFGDTTVALGASSASLAGISSINNVGISATSGLAITSASGAVRTTVDYTLGNACEKTYTTDGTLNDGNTKLPEAQAVKTYVESRINDQTRTSRITFNNGITVSSAASFANNVALGANAKLSVDNVSDAARVSTSVSGNASIFTKGGIEAKKSIYSEADIVGMNNGTYSLRSLKENITPFKKSATKLINDIKIVNYNYIADPEKNHKVGFIADDTDELFATKNHNIMDQSNCIGLLLKAVQELSAEVKKLKEELNERTATNTSGQE